MASEAPQFIVRCSHIFTTGNHEGTRCETNTKTSSPDEKAYCYTHDKKRKMNTTDSKYLKFLGEHGYDHEKLSKCVFPKCIHLTLPTKEYCLRHIEFTPDKPQEIRKCKKCNTMTSTWSQLCSKHSKFTFADIEEVFQKHIFKK